MSTLITIDNFLYYDLAPAVFMFLVFNLTWLFVWLWVD